MDGHSGLRWRLSLFMFLLYAPGGAVLPLFSLRLRDDLHFLPMEMGWTFAAQPLAALLAPLLAGQIADRWFACDRCVAVCAFASGGAVWLLADVHTFPAVFA